MTKLNKIISKFDELNIDALLLFDEKNQFYFSEFKYSDGAILITKEKSYLITDFRYTEAAKSKVKDGFEIVAPKSQLQFIEETLSLHGIKSVDTDMVYRELTAKKSPCLDALVSEFGEQIISPFGALDRTKLRSIVFSGEGAREKRSKLNEIAHKFILDRTREILEEYRQEGRSFSIVDAPLLFESGFNKECDYILCVLADKEQRILRIIKRDGLSREAAELRIASQLSDGELISLSDFTIINNGDIQQLKDGVDRIVGQLIEKRQKQ
jgi:dephospho-CoA kinase